MHCAIRSVATKDFNLEHKKLFEALGRSKFRSRFRLGIKEYQSLHKLGLEAILEHGFEFINTRLRPKEILNDGKQTPMRGHPVFIAQHATATCCRGCLSKWHKISKEKELTDSEFEYVLSVIKQWLVINSENVKKESKTKGQLSLF